MQKIKERGEIKRFTEKEWLDEGTKRFGENRLDWEFECPYCSTSQTARDFLDNSEDKEEMRKLISSGVVGFSCIGRYVEKEIGCNWTCGGLFQIHTTSVFTEEGKEVPCFDFSEHIGGSNSV